MFIGIGMNLIRGGYASPASLFAAAEPGVWYDPSDLTTLFQDSAGTTPVTAPNQPVGKMLDKSGRGFHATQATAGQRPIYGINPITGTRNLLTYTEQVDNAVWLKNTTTVTANTAIAPDGTMTADTATSTSTDPYIYQDISGTSATNTFSIYAKGTGTAIGKQPRIYLISPGVQNTSSSLLSALTSEWQRYTFTSTFAINPTSIRGRFDYLDNTSLTNESVYLWGAQLETGSTATAYQKVVTQYEVTEAGVQSASYIAFDGVDDFMYANQITPNTDKVQVFSGVRKLSDSPLGMLVEFGSGVSTSIGTWGHTLPDTTSTGSLGLDLRGSGAYGTQRISTGVSPATFVSAIAYDLSGTTFDTERPVKRINGVNATVISSSGSGDTGGGNFTQKFLNIGRRGGGLSPFNGRIYSLIVRFGANLTAGQITSTESWVNGKTGAY